jgi:ferredoxin
MSAKCPTCSSYKTLSINSAYRIAVVAKAVNRLIIHQVSKNRRTARNPLVVATLEELAARLFDALDLALKIKYQNASDTSATHVCIRCGLLFSVCPNLSLDTNPNP